MNVREGSALGVGAGPRRLPRGRSGTRQSSETGRAPANGDRAITHIGLSLLALHKNALPIQQVKKMFSLQTTYIDLKSKIS